MAPASSSARKLSSMGIAAELLVALRSQNPIRPLREPYPGLSIEDAYQISDEFLSLRCAGGEHPVGYKIGLTSDAARAALGVAEPDFGYLTDAMQIRDGQVVLATLIEPRVEVEVAFLLKKDLPGPDITAADVIDATEAVTAAFEIVDSRISGWNVHAVDTIADNGSAGAFVLGADRLSPRDLAFEAITCALYKNGAPVAHGAAINVLKSPLAAVTWLANFVSGSKPLKAGAVILSGTMIPPAPVARGDQFEIRMDYFDPVRLTFR